jgi:hypothetical protein
VVDRDECSAASILTKRGHDEAGQQPEVPLTLQLSQGPDHVDAASVADGRRHEWEGLISDFEASVQANGLSLRTAEHYSDGAGTGSGMPPCACPARRRPVGEMRYGHRRGFEK